MRAIVAIEVEGGTAYFEITKEMMDAEPEFPFKLGELQGLVMKHGGEVTYERRNY